MALYRDLTEEEIRKVKNDIISLGQEAIGYIELGDSDSTVFEIMQKKRALEDLVERWEEWQKIKNCSFSDLI